MCDQPSVNLIIFRGLIATNRYLICCQFCLIINAIIFHQNRVRKVLHKNCLLTLDGASLDIDHVIKIEYGEEENENIEFDYEELVQVIDYVEAQNGDIISIQITKELLTGYLYHFKVTTKLKNGKGERVFKSIIHPRGINYFYLFIRP